MKLQMKMSKKLAREIVADSNHGILAFASWLHSRARKSYDQNVKCLSEFILAEARRVLAEKGAKHGKNK